MANVSAPFGLKPVKHPQGIPIRGNLYRCSATTSARVGLYEPVITTGSADSAGMMVVKKATITTADIEVKLRGSVIGIYPTKPGHTVTSLVPPTTDGDIYVEDDTHYVMVADDPVLEFEIQDRSEGMTLANFGQNCAIESQSASTTTGLSGARACGDLIGSTATATLKVIGAAYRADGSNVVTSSYQTLLVRINQHELGHATAGV